MCSACNKIYCKRNEKYAESIVRGVEGRDGLSFACVISQKCIFFLNTCMKIIFCFIRKLMDDRHTFIVAVADIWSAMPAPVEINAWTLAFRDDSCCVLFVYLSSPYTAMDVHAIHFKSESRPFALLCGILNSFVYRKSVSSTNTQHNSIGVSSLALPYNAQSRLGFAEFRS